MAAGVWLAAAVGGLVPQALAEEPRGEGECTGERADVDVWLDVAPRNDAVRVTYRLSRPVSTLALALPQDEEILDRLRVESHPDVHGVASPGKIERDGDITLSPTPARTVVLHVPPDPPGHKVDRQYPVAFAVAGRGIGVYLPFLLPNVCGDVSVFVQGGPQVAAVVDGDYRPIEEAYELADAGGFVLVGRSLELNAVMQFSVTIPGWLEEAIRDSYQHAQRGLTRVLDVSPVSASLFVDYHREGAKSGQPRSGGDAPGELCAVRFRFRGEDWEEERPDLLSRVHDLVVHELAHCYQPQKKWQPWAHEGHARFLEKLLATHPDGRYVADSRAEEGFVRDFDACMNDLRVRKRQISPYSCGSVAYWLRWLETGRVHMLEEHDTRNPVETSTVAGRFLMRTVTEVEVTEFVRGAGVKVEVSAGVLENAAAVRSRLVWTLLSQGCGDDRRGFWTHDASVTLDSGCPELHQFEVDTIAGGHIFNDVHRSYAATAASCGDRGQASLTGVDGDTKWISCDEAYEWPATVGSEYRLIAPFAHSAKRAP